MAFKYIQYDTREGSVKLLADPLLFQANEFFCRLTDVVSYSLIRLWKYRELLASLYIQFCVDRLNC